MTRRSYPANDREEFGECNSRECESPAYYLIRDRKDANQVWVCGDHLAETSGAKGADE